MHAEKRNEACNRLKIRRTDIDYDAHSSSHLFVVWIVDRGPIYPARDGSMPKYKARCIVQTREASVPCEYILPNVPVSVGFELALRCC